MANAQVGECYGSVTVSRAAATPGRRDGVMPWQPKATGGLVKCGRCGKRYSNLLAHVCRGQRRGRTQFAPKFSGSLKCGKCGKRYANPLTHVCVVGTDFRRRRARHERQQKKAAAAARRKQATEARQVRAAEAKRGKPAGRPKPKHDYAACGDDDCPRFPCRVYREGQTSGWAKGYARGEIDGRVWGYQEGHPVGYAEGFAAGVAAAGGGQQAS